MFKQGKHFHRNNVQLGQFGRYRTNVSAISRARDSFSRASAEGNLLALHPTVKPVALVADPMMDCSSRGDIVLDPFLGSGTTVVAASAPAVSAMASSGSQVRRHRGPSLATFYRNVCRAWRLNVKLDDLGKEARMRQR